VISNLAPDQIKSSLSQLQFNWKTANDCLVLELRAKDFTEAVWAIDKIAKIAEELNHHPDICLKNYNQLTISLSTHSTKGLTKKDFLLGKKIEGVITRIKN
jgi:4a-hydroxytetrahydrobiopterin dehydratase